MHSVTDKWANGFTVRASGNVFENLLKNNFINCFQVGRVGSSKGNYLMRAEENGFLLHDVGQLIPEQEKKQHFCVVYLNNDPSETTVAVCNH